MLQAGVVIGCGSASFEMLRYLTERLPVMVTPKWVHTGSSRSRSATSCGTSSARPTMPADVNRRFDIGGPDVLTYRDMMQRYAAVAGLAKRRHRAGAGAVARAVEPLGRPRHAGAGRLARPLVESLRNTVVAAEHRHQGVRPGPARGLIGFDAGGRAGADRDPGPRRADPLVVRVDRRARRATALPTDPDWAGGSLYEDERTREVDAVAEHLWTVIEGIGGKNGLVLVGARLVGARPARPGRRRARPASRTTQRRATSWSATPLDFWRVEEIDDRTFLRLRAEMKLPGLAWLELQVGSTEGGTTTFHHRALFHPDGLFGHLYWWSIYPFHGIIFGSMQKNIAKAAEALED